MRKFLLALAVPLAMLATACGKNDAKAVDDALHRLGIVTVNRTPLLAEAGKKPVAGDQAGFRIDLQEGGARPVEHARDGFVGEGLQFDRHRPRNRSRSQRNQRRHVPILERQVQAIAM